MKIYTVFGETGEYSGRSTWAVVSFFSEEKAKKRILLATKRAKEIKAQYGNSFHIPGGVINEYDSKMRLEYTGVNYFYEATTILDSE